MKGQVMGAMVAGGASAFFIKDFNSILKLVFIINRLLLLTKVIVLTTSSSGPLTFRKQRVCISSNFDEKMLGEG